MNQAFLNIKNSFVRDSFTFREFDYTEMHGWCSSYPVQLITLMLFQSSPKVLPVSLAYIQKLWSSPCCLINCIDAIIASHFSIMGCFNRIRTFPFNFKPFYLALSVRGGYTVVNNNYGN